MLKVDIASAPHEKTISLSGRFDERAEPPDILVDPPAKVQLQLRGLTSMNSAGALIWIKWLRGILGKTEVVLHACPSFFVELANMVDGIVSPGVRIQSFMVPYYNPDSGDVEYIESICGQHFDEYEITLPVLVRSEVNGAKLELDTVAARYLRFLKITYPNIRIEEIRGK